MGLLKWALIFFLVAIVAGVLGFTGIAAGAADIARVLFFLFAAIVLALIFLGVFVFNQVT